MNSERASAIDLHDSLTLSKFFKTAVYEYDSVDSDFLMGIPEDWMNTFDPVLYSNFMVYQYYQSLSNMDNEVERRIMTIEYGVKTFWDGYGLRSARILLDMKRSFLGPDSYTPEDLVRKAIIDL